MTEQPPPTPPSSEPEPRPPSGSPPPAPRQAAQPPPWPELPGGPATRTAELIAAVGQLFELNAELRGQVDAILDELQARRTSVPTIHWSDLGPAMAQRLWHALYTWVTWLLDRYAIREIPRGCWWQHGLIVEELTALWIAYQGAYGEDATAIAATFWHEHLDRCRERIRLRLTQQGNCGAAGHQAVHLPPHPQQIRDSFAAFVTADVAARGATDHSSTSPAEVHR